MILFYKKNKTNPVLVFYFNVNANFEILIFRDKIKIEHNKKGIKWLKILKQVHIQMIK